MIDVELMQEYIRDVNPIPNLDDIDACELARFVALTQAARPDPSAKGRDSATTDLLEFRAEPGDVSRSGRLRHRAGQPRRPAVAAGIAVVLIVGVATLLLRSADSDTTPPATTPPVTTTLPTQSSADRTLAPDG